MISTKDLLIIFGAGVAFLLSSSLTAALVWVGVMLRKDANALREHTKELESLKKSLATLVSEMSQSSVLAKDSINEACASLRSSVIESCGKVSDLSPIIKEFSDFTKYHAEAAVKNASAVSEFCASVKELSKSLFGKEAASGLTIPNEIEMGREFDIQSVLRESPGMSRNDAEYAIGLGRNIGME